MTPDGLTASVEKMRAEGVPDVAIDTFRHYYEQVVAGETGLLPEHVEVLGATPGWLRYRLPQRAIRRNDRLVCIGQKQVWFLLRLAGEESDLRLDLSDKPEFDHWRWVDFWYPLEHVVMFKRGVYASALRHLAPFARHVAGTQAVPVPAPDPRAGWNNRHRSRPRPGAPARGGSRAGGKSGDPVPG
ncbi:MAG: RNA pyrophosphohydrolase [Proteobacteria bacterium]|nr:RNA pyrophosphohydrolase [Pseudomonadota bacterium]